MKKLVILGILLLLLVPVLTFADDSVFIKNVEIVSQEEAYEVNPASFDGLKLNLDLAISNGSTGEVTYKVTIKNNSKEPYEIDKSKTFKQGKYVEYQFDFEEKENRKIIEANEEKTMLVTVSIGGNVDPDDFVDGKYVETNDMQLDFSNEKNPQTSTKGIIVIVLMVGIVLLTIGVTKNTKAAYLFVILLLPISIYAYEKLSLSINTKVEIRQATHLVYIPDECQKSRKIEIPYDNGMTWKEFEDIIYPTLSEDNKRDINSLLYFIKEERIPLDFNTIFDTSGQSILFIEEAKLVACNATIDYPEYQTNMTPEEEALYNEKLAEAREQSIECANQYTHTASFNDSIHSYEEGYYILIKTVSCPN